MKTVLSLALVFLVGAAAWKLWKYYGEVEGTRAPRRPGTIMASPTALPKLPPELEQELAAAQQQGAAGLRAWLDQHDQSPLVPDSRRAAIELDYIILLAPNDPVRAKRIFSDVKNRTPSDSPVYPRIQALAPTFE